MPTLHVPNHVWAALSHPELHDVVPPSHVAGVVAQLVDAFPHVPDRDWKAERLWDPKAVTVSGRLDEAASVVVQIAPDRRETGLLVDDGKIIDECALWPDNDLPAWLAGTISLWATLGRGWMKGKTTKPIIVVDERTAHPWFFAKDKDILVNWRQDGVSSIVKQRVWAFPQRDEGHGGFHLQGLPDVDQPTLVTKVSEAVEQGLIVLEERPPEGWMDFPIGSDN